MHFTVKCTSATSSSTLLPSLKRSRLPWWDTWERQSRGFTPGVHGHLPAFLLMVSVSAVFFVAIKSTYEYFHTENSSRTLSFHNSTFGAGSQQSYECVKAIMCILIISGVPDRWTADQQDREKLVQEIIQYFHFICHPSLNDLLFWKSFYFKKWLSAKF